MIFDGLVKNVNNKVSKFLMYPRFLTMCLRMTQFGQITHTQKYVAPFHTKKLFTTPRVNSPSFSSKIVPLFDTMLVQQGEGSGTPTEPHHTPSPEAQSPSHTTHTSPTLPPVTATSLPIVTQSDTPIVRQYTKRTRIAQSSVLLTVADEPASPLRDVSQGEACPTDSGFIADHDRATIDKLKERVKMLEDREGVAATRSGDDAPIKGMTIVLASEVVDVPTGSGSIPTASTPAEEQVPTGNDVVPTTSLVFTTATVVTSYRRRKGKEVMVESKTLKKQKVHEQIDAQVARELEEQLEKEDQRRSEQIARDAKIERIHAEEELQIMIDSLDKNNETVAKYLQDLEADGRLYSYGSKEEAERIKRKGLNLEQESAKKQKTSEEVLEEAMSPKEKIMKINYEFYACLVEWKLYDTCGVHYVTSKDKEIFILVEKDYPLRKGLALMMISYKLQVENYS
nr:hypothetical protein [Tanacetum cinerariifolium]